MLFLSNDWWSRWNLLVSASDAPANGCGVSTSVWTIEVVCQAGRTRERDRFRDCRAVSARVHAMEAAGLDDDFTSLEEGEDLAIEAAKVIVLRQLGVDFHFPEVASCGLFFSRWVHRFRRAWRHQNIQVLEARALVMSLRRVALSLRGRDVNSRRRQSRSMLRLRSVSDPTF